MTLSPSIDPIEVDKFRALADAWWQSDGPFWPLHLLNATRLEYLKCSLGSSSSDPALPFSGLRVLDVGCGGGLLAEPMARLGARVTGVDVVGRNIEIARMHAQQSGLEIEYRLCSVEDMLNSHSGSFDLLLNMEVVEHVADLDSFMFACCALVKPGGKQVVATINRNVWAWFAAVFMAERVLRLLPVGTHHWSKLRRPSEIKARLLEHDFELLRQTGVKLNPFNRHMTLSRSMAINYMLVAQKQH